MSKDDESLSVQPSLSPAAAAGLGAEMARTSKCKNFLHTCAIAMHLHNTHQALHLLLHINKARMQSLSTKTCSIAPINATKTILCI